MERLTEEKQIGCFASLKDKSEAKPGAFSDYNCFYAHSVAVTRLKAYEDTGLEPEDMKRVFSEDAILKLAGQALGTTAEHLRNLLSIEKAGRLVVLSDAEADALKAYREGRMEIKCQGCWPVDGETAERPKCFYNDNGSPLCLGLAVGDDDYPIEKCQKCWYSEYASVEREEAEAALGKDEDK